MKFPFDIDKLPDNLKTLFKDDVNNWSFVVEKIRKEIVKNSKDIDLTFCYSYALFKQGKNVFVDDLKEITENCIALIKEYELDSISKNIFKKELDSTLELVLLKNKELEILNSLNIESLSIKEKKELALNLSDKGGIENYRKSALIFNNLSKLVKEEYNIFYYLGNETISLFRSNQYELAKSKFLELIEWDIEKGPSAYPYIISYIFSKMLLKTNNKSEFTELWNKAKTHKSIIEDGVFPVAHKNQDEILVKAIEFKLKDVISELLIIYDKKRNKCTITDEIKTLIKDVRNDIQQ